MVTIGVHEQDIEPLIEGCKFAYRFFKKKAQETALTLREMEQNENFQNRADVLCRFIDKLERIKNQI